MIIKICKSYLSSDIQIGSPDSVRWPTVGKYKVDVQSFESLALPELQVQIYPCFVELI